MLGYEGPKLQGFGPDRRSVMRIISTLVLVWLVVGVLAAYQRDYLSRADDNCSDVGTILVTVAAGPLNYFGANPKISCEAPTPSQ
jgi:hypothetical protein